MEGPVRLTLEVAYPMFDLSEVGEMWTIVRIESKAHGFEFGDEVVATVSCKDEECRFTGVSKEPKESDMWVRGEVFRVVGPNEVLVVPEIFPLSLGASTSPRQIEFEKGVTKLVKCTYRPEENGHLDFVSWDFLGEEARPPFTWK